MALGSLPVVGRTIPLNPQMSLSIRTGITMWAYRGCCNFVVKIVHAPTPPWPSAFSSKILSNIPDGDIPPNIITPLPSGDVDIALKAIP